MLNKLLKARIVGCAQWDGASRHQACGALQEKVVRGMGVV